MRIVLYPLCKGNNDSAEKINIRFVKTIISMQTIPGLFIFQGKMVKGRNEDKSAVLTSKIGPAPVFFKEVGLFRGTERTVQELLSSINNFKQKTDIASVVNSNVPLVCCQ